MSGSHGSYKFKEIAPVPDVKGLLDIVLSKTQRKTPTVTHPGYEISRVRSFYTRKVKFLMQTFHDKFNDILTQFPRLDDIHPFYADLCNVLYDRDHYKIALGQVNAVSKIIDTVAKDYVRLLKYADSPYKCKVLKRAGFGRMCTTAKKLGESLSYLEEVRKHLGRLPAIDPNARTLILTGYPNVGKSSFMNKVSNANVDVQPYAFTTKSLFAGHFDYKYARWQVIDTPGILDHPMDERNTIEMTAVTALAHLHAAILFFLDPSGTCGYSIMEQVSLFDSIKALFKSKPVIVVINKVDLIDITTLPAEEQALIQGMKDSMPNIEFVACSCLKESALDDAKNLACERLMEVRLKKKIENSQKLDSIQNRLYTTPTAAPSHRPANVPQSVLEEKASGIKKKIKTEKELQDEQGGAGVYTQDWKKNYLLENDEWKYDVVPEFFDGKNVADFVDADIEKRLAALEKEEALELEAWGLNYDKEEEVSWDATRAVLKEVHSKIGLRQDERRMERTINGPRRLPRGVGAVDGAAAAASFVENNLADESKVKDVVREGRVKTTKLSDHLQKTLVKRPNRVRAEEDHPVNFKGRDVDLDDAEMSNKKRKRMQSLERNREKSQIRELSNSAHRSRTPSRLELSMGADGTGMRERGHSLSAVANMRFKKDKKMGEADRFIGTAMPRHLYSGKMTMGTKSHR
eukprot:GDKJ01026112.1.p1 GENE.GDKJ01026112.1~~GDKJ01026112.1.p1  ORF type:complete len:689 (-),score=199.02 GDKJ01026112.1:154-2220(-)